MRTGGEMKMDALELLRKAEWDADHNLITAGEYEKIIELFKDVKVVVRCKDCKHQDPDRVNDGSGCYVCRKGHGWKPDDWFCADGERR